MKVAPSTAPIWRRSNLTSPTLAAMTLPLASRMNDRVLVVVKPGATFWKREHVLIDLLERIELEPFDERMQLALPFENH